MYKLYKLYYNKLYNSINNGWVYRNKSLFVSMLPKKNVKATLTHPLRR